jgi:hypothetical protein
MSVWNGHYECTCYHPVFVFNQFGDLERCSLRPGNVHSASSPSWRDLMATAHASIFGRTTKRIAYLLTVVVYSKTMGQVCLDHAKEVSTSLKYI